MSSGAVRPAGVPRTARGATPGLALGLWIGLAFVVWNVTFDWSTRRAASDFAYQQVRQHMQGAPTVTINEGFRPLVRAAAFRSTGWAGLLAGTGALAVAWASRRDRTSTSPRRTAP